MSVINPFTKLDLQPIGHYKSGRPIYPILGGSVDAGSVTPAAGGQQQTPTPTPTPPQGGQAATDQ